MTPLISQHLTDKISIGLHYALSYYWYSTIKNAINIFIVSRILSKCFYDIIAY